MSAQISLDFGAAFVKLMKGTKDHIDVFGIVSNPIGKPVPETENESISLATAIKGLFTEKNINVKKARVVLSETSVYSRVIALPLLSTAELSNAIHWEAEQYIPVPLEEVQLSWEVVTKPERRTGDEKMTVLLVAAPNKTIQGIMSVLSKLVIEPEIIEPEIVATTRTMNLENSKLTVTMMVTLGASATSITIFDSSDLIFTHRLDTGSTAITRAIASALSLPMNQSEEYKRSYGIQSNVLEGKLYQVITPLMMNLVTEIKKAQSFVLQKGLVNRTVKIVLTGGGSLMPGLVPFLSSQTGTEVNITSVFGANSKVNVPGMNSIYTATYGALLR